MTAPHYEDGSVTLFAGDCVEVMRGMADSSVDAVVCDPPYGLEFMGREWDSFKATGSSSLLHSPKDEGRTFDNSSGHMWDNTKALPRFPSAGRPFQAWCEVWAAECLRVLKPGGHLLAFGGSRTAHRLACAIEDAGFEIRDSITWLYGSGFPKSLDVGKAIDRAAGAEREITGTRVRLGDKKTYAYNPASDIYGADNGAGTGHRPPLTAPATPDAERWQGWGTALKPASEPIVVARRPLGGRTVAGCVLEFGTGALNVDACRVGTTEDTSRARAVVRDTAAPFGAGFAMGGNGHDAGRWPPNVVLDGSQAEELDRQSGQLTSGARDSSVGPSVRYGRSWSGSPGGDADSGGASRFFPTFRYQAKAPGHQRPADGDTRHATVKPVDLMRWLVRLVTPPLTVSCENRCHETAETTSPDPGVQGLRGDVQALGQQPEAAAVLQGVRGRGDETPDAGLSAVSADVQAGQGRGTGSGLLLEGVRGEGVRVGEAQGTDADPSGVHRSVRPGAPDVDADRLPVGAPEDRGRGVGANADLDRSRPPPERDQGRQPTGEPRGTGQEGSRPDPEATPEADQLPALRGFDRRVGTCKNCGGALVERGGLVLDPFAGSGTTGEACIVEGFRCVLIEREPSYLPLIVARLSKPIQPDLFGGAA